MTWQMWLGMIFFVALAGASVVAVTRLNPGFRRSLGLSREAHDHPENGNIDSLIDPHTEETSMRFEDKIAVDPAKAVARAREGLEPIPLS